MALAPPLPPVDHSAARVHWLSQLAREVGPAPRVLAPLPVYAVGAGDLAEGHLLDRARLRSWRSLVLGEAGRLFALDLVPPAAAGEPWSLGGLAHGAPTEALRARLADAAGHAREGEELRVLGTTGPVFEALWLHGPARDALVPLRDHRPELVAGAAYAPAQVLAALAPLVHRGSAGGGEQAN